ncbi:hypothetical protein DPMN_188086 [Dreissena polymorpha]|uniref:Uncharacterized protein n=1 Tax=Dreissena polymorpha TaxID=45954 RepID=A0A9D4DQ67_DREPO|nr:hypothetical protein DPMN_188086 [Dreissena polymorpha]
MPFSEVLRYQFEVNRCRNEEILVKGNFGLVWSKWAGCPRVDNGAMHKNRCRKEEVIVKGNFGWVWSMLAERRRIDRIVIREVQYQFEVNRCRNEEVIVKGNFGWVGSMWVGRSRAGNGGHELLRFIVIGEVQYQFEVNRCRNEEVYFQGSNSGQDGRTDRRQGFSKSVWITRKNATAMYQKAYASS